MSDAPKPRRRPASASPADSTGALALERRGIRGLFYLGGCVAGSAGLHTVAAGARAIPGEDRASASVESELRFYGAFYAAYGFALLRVAPDADRDGAAVKSMAGALFLGGLARGAAWIAAGRPHRLHRALLAVELAAPPALIAWQRRIERLGSGA